MFRVYTNADVVGVELCGALKNIVALGAGAIDGMGYGENAKAGFVTRGLAEIARYGFAEGANPLTVAGLAGFGDLIATCTSKFSRNRTSADAREGIDIATFPSTSAEVPKASRRGGDVSGLGQRGGSCDHRETPPPERGKPIRRPARLWTARRRGVAGTGPRSAHLGTFAAARVRERKTQEKIEA